MKGATTGTVAFFSAVAVGVLAIALWRAAPVEAVWPVERAKASFVRRVGARWDGLWHGVACGAENVRLRREVDSLAMERSDVEAVLSENARLRRALGFAERGGGAWIAAEVLSPGGGASATRRVIRAGKGSLAGVRRGAAVAVPEGLVGEVVSVTPHTCEVLLVTDPSVQVACTVIGERPLRGIAAGESDDSLVVRHLKPGVPIAPGSRVMTSGLGGVFPAGILVGSFISEEDGGDANGLERAGKVRPAVDPSVLEDVFIRRAEP